MSILIDSVTPHTPAAKAGIQAGDRLSPSTAISSTMCWITAFI